MKTAARWFAWVFIAWILIIAAGWIVDVWNKNSQDHQEQLQVLHERAEHWRKRVHESDRRIQTLTLKIDSLQNIRHEIKIIHADRHVLPFPVADTGARSRYFEQRYPDMFTGIGH